MTYRPFTTLLVLLCICSFALASPLDDRIAAFSDAAAVPDQAQVTQLLKTGLDENRSAEALAAVQPWLNRNHIDRPDGLFYAGQAAERSGQWLDAIGYYQRLLQSANPDKKLAGPAADATYRLLLNAIGDENAAYLFMRKDGNTIRAYGKAKRYDRWFLDRARQKRDLIAVMERLTVIAADNATDPAAFESDFEWLCTELEHFRKEEAEIYEGAQKLAAVPRTPALFKVRLNWAATVIPYNQKLDELRNNNAPADPKLTDAPLAAAAQLINVAPDRGPLLVAKGWGTEYDGHHGTCAARFNIEGERKKAQLLAAMPKMSPDKRDDLLGYRLAHGRVRFDVLDVYPLVIKHPESFNTLDATHIPLFDKAKLTVEQAKQLAPHLARNPHTEAAMIRAIAAASSLEASKIAEAMMKTESWRFAKHADAVNTAWGASTVQDVEHKALVKQYGKSDPRFDQIKQQVAKKSDGKQRLAAFDTLYKDLISNAPTTPGALALWDDLFTNAEDADLTHMIKVMVTDTSGVRGELLRKALAKARFGKKNNGSMWWQGQVYDNQFRYHRQPVQQAVPDLIAHLQGMIDKQAQAGTIDPHVFGMWLHTVDPRKDDAKTLIQKVVNSPAYAKLDPSYHQSVADGNHFGVALATPAITQAQPQYVSRELLTLTTDATPQQVEAAFNTVMKRVATLPQPAALHGLQPVAALPKWSDQTRRQVLSLFSDHAPIGIYPTRQGYEQLIQRLCKEIAETEKWGEIEPHLPGLWHAAAWTDDHNHFRNAQALTVFTEAALEAEQVSIALASARNGTNSRAARDMKARNNPALTEVVGRISQVQGKAAIEIGIIDIPVDERDPAYPIYKSQAEFAIGNTGAAWELYTQNADQLQPIIRQLTVPYCLWLLERNIEARESDRAEALIKELTVWSRQAAGTFTATQEGELKIAYADAAFQKGALQTAKAWYRRVADAVEYKGTPLQHEAILRSVRVDRASKDFGSALAELDKLMLVRDQGLRTRVHFARAEVFYDQERYADAFNEASSVLKREPSHPDALILLGQAQLEMRKLVDASEIELGISRDQKLIVPGEVIKINLSDPALNISGVGTEIEVEIWSKSGDRERVMLYQLGDDKTKFRAEIPTKLGKRQPGDKVLQILGRDEIQYGYSKRFREKMTDLPADPDVVITVASDATLSASAGAFPARKGERKLDLEELGVSSAQQALGTRQVRPGNPVYLRITDPDQGKTDDIDEIAVSVETSNGDLIPRLVLKETGTHSGEFEAMIPTGRAQALAFASESAPGSDPNMVISAEDYPGWSAAVGSKSNQQMFIVDLNDNVAPAAMTISCSDPAQALTRFVVQTSMNGTDWQTRARFPDDPAPYDGRPTFESFHTRNGGITLSTLNGLELPSDWRKHMAASSSREKALYAAAHVTNLSAEQFAIQRVHHPNSEMLSRFRAFFYQPAAAIRTFRLSGLSTTERSQTVLLIDGKPAGTDADDPYTITRELAPGIHEIEVWHVEQRGELEKRKPQLLTDVDGQEKLAPCPDKMFDPATFPEPVRESIAKPSSVTASGEKPGQFDIAFGEGTKARAIRLAIVGHEGPAPSIHKITLTDRKGNQRLPVAADYQKLRANDQLEVVPGDTIRVRYEDDRVVSERRTTQQKSLTVAYNTATIEASFLTYVTNEEGERRLVIEPIRRFKLNDNVGIVINDPDLDQTPEPDQIELTVKSSSGSTIKLTALETGPHTGEFLGKVFPVESDPKRDSEILVSPGGTITAIYRDEENLDPGIPTDRTVTIEHAIFKQPAMAVYDTASETLPPPKRDSEEDEDENERGPEVIKPRQALSFNHLDGTALKQQTPEAIIGSTLRFDVIASQLAFANSSQAIAYVQTESGRKAHKTSGNATSNMPFDIRVPGTLKLDATPSRGANTIAPDGYTITSDAAAPNARPALDEGRFAFSVPIILDDTPIRSFATDDAESLPSSMVPDALAVRPGDKIYVGFAYLDPQGKAQWLTATFELNSHAFLDIMNSRYRRDITSAFVGEKLFVRVIAPDRDTTPDRDTITVNLKAKSGVSVPYQLRESEVHSGVFKGSFGLNYASEPVGGKLPSVALHGLPVKYGDTVTVSYKTESTDAPQPLNVLVNKGADGTVEPFTKQYGEDGVAVQTTFTLAECFFELAKHHRKMEQKSLARREMGHAQKLLAEAIASHRDDELQAHAEYLLGNLAQEYADLSENQASKKAMYQDALARFSKIPLDYPDTEFAPKAQFKKGLVYEKLGEVDIAVEEYVKLAYKYPEHELIPSVMSRLGAYFQSQGKIYKTQAESLEAQKDNVEAQGEALKLRDMAKKEYRNAAQVFSKLQERFPNDALAGLAGLRSAQNYMRAADYSDAIAGFQKVVDTEEYDDKTVRSQAMYWQGISNEYLSNHTEAYQLYRRVTFDFPDSVWAKQARGRLADPVFERIIKIEEEARERLLEGLKNQ